MPPTQSKHTAPPPDQLADVLYEGLDVALDEQCAERHERHLTLQRERAPASDPALRVRLECRNQPGIRAVISVSHFGGNVYDVRCNVEEGPTQQFSFTLSPDTESVFARSPSLDQKITSFLLDTLEQRVGRNVLAANDE